MHHYPSISFLGAGSIAQALISGLLASGHPPQHIHAHRRTISALEPLAKQGVQIHAQAADAAKSSPIVVLAVKPWHMADFAYHCQPFLNPSQLIVSVAAGVSLEQLSNYLPAHAADHMLVRMMPNTPVAIRQGVLGCYAANGENPLLTQAFTNLGLMVWLNREEDMHALTAIAGCGPAYYFRILEYMQRIAQELGLDEQISHQMVLQTLRGAATMAHQQQQQPFANLVAQVGTTGSATNAALHTFADNNLQQTLHAGVKAAWERSHQLGQ